MIGSNTRAFDRAVWVIVLVQTAIVICGTLLVTAVLKIKGYQGGIVPDSFFNSAALFVRHSGAVFLLFPLIWAASAQPPAETRQDHGFPCFSFSSELLRSFTDSATIRRLYGTRVSFEEVFFQRYMSSMRCGEPGHRITVAIQASRGLVADLGSAGEMDFVICYPDGTEICRREGVSRDEALELWLLLQEGKYDEIRQRLVA